jgi:hypothetical protein
MFLSGTDDKFRETVSHADFVRRGFLHALCDQYIVIASRRLPDTVLIRPPPHSALFTAWLSGNDDFASVSISRFSHSWNKIVAGLSTMAYDGTYARRTKCALIASISRKYRFRIKKLEPAYMAAASKSSGFCLSVIGSSLFVSAIVFFLVLNWSSLGLAQAVITGATTGGLQATYNPSTMVDGTVDWSALDGSGSAVSAYDLLVLGAGEATASNRGPQSVDYSLNATPTTAYTSVITQSWSTTSSSTPPNPSSQQLAQQFRDDAANPDTWSEVAGGGTDLKPTTLEFWVNPANFTTQGQIIYETGGGTGTGVYLDGSTLIYSVAGGGHEQLKVDLSNVPLYGDLTATNEFMQIVIEADTRASSPTDGYARAYLNGLFVGDTVAGGFGSATARNDAAGWESNDWDGGDAQGLAGRGQNNLGGRGSNWSHDGDVYEAFEGDIAIARFYGDSTNGVQLTQGQIAANYNAVVGVDAANSQIVDMDFAVVGSSPVNWSTAASWNIGAGPNANQIARIIGNADNNTDEVVVVDTTGLTAGTLMLGTESATWDHAKDNQGVAVLDVAVGGELTVANDLLLGLDNTDGLRGRIDMNGGTLNVSGDVWFGLVGQESGIINLNSGALNVGGDILLGGNASGGTINVNTTSGVLTVTGGNINAGSFVVADTADGSYTVAAGQTVTTANAYVGEGASRIAELTVDGGTVNATDQARMGRGVGSDSTLTIANGGTFDVGANFVLADVENTTSTVDVVDGTLNVGGILYGGDDITAPNNGESTINIGVGGAAPDVNTGSFRVAQHSVGHLRMDSGTLDTTGAFIIASEASADGDFTLNNGMVAATAGFVVADKGTGDLLIKDGQLNVSGGNLEVANATTGVGTATIDGGAYSQIDNNLIVGQSPGAAGVMGAQATFTVNDGDVDVTNIIRVANQENTTGRFYLYGGTVDSDSVDTFSNVAAGDFNDVGIAEILVQGTSAVMTTNSVTLGAINIDMTSNTVDNNKFTVAGGGVVNVGANFGLATGGADVKARLDVADAASDGTQLNIEGNLVLGPGTTQVNISGGTVGFQDLTNAGTATVNVSGGVTTIAADQVVSGGSLAMNVTGGQLNYTSPNTVRDVTDLTFDDGAIQFTFEQVSGPEPINVSGVGTYDNAGGNPTVDLISIGGVASIDDADAVVWSGSGSAWDTDGGKWDRGYTPAGGTLFVGESVVLFNNASAPVGSPSGILSTDANFAINQETSDVNGDSDTNDIVATVQTTDVTFGAVKAVLDGNVDAGPVTRASDLVIDPSAASDQHAAKLDVIGGAELQLTGAETDLIISGNDNSENPSQDVLIENSTLTVAGNVIFGGAPGAEGGTLRMTGTSNVTISGNVVEGSLDGTHDSSVLTAHLLVDGGTLDVAGDMWLQSFRTGDGAGSTGSYTIPSTQTLNIMGELNAGVEGSGTIVNDGGTIIADSMNIARSGGVGVFTQTGGSASLTSGSNGLDIGEVDGSTGTFNLEGGTFSINGGGFDNAEVGATTQGVVNIGVGGGNPTLIVNGGNFETANAGIGVVTMDSGTLYQNDNNLIVMQAESSDGTFTLNRGVVDLRGEAGTRTNADLNMNAGTGVLNASGGTIYVSRDLNMTSAGTAGAPATATVNLTGATVYIRDDLETQNGGVGTDTINISAGQLMFGVGFASGADDAQLNTIGFRLASGDDLNYFNWTGGSIYGLDTVVNLQNIDGTGAAGSPGHPNGPIDTFWQQGGALVVDNATVTMNNNGTYRVGQSTITDSDALPSIDFAVDASSPVTAIFMDHASAGVEIDSEDLGGVRINMTLVGPANTAAIVTFDGGPSGTNLAWDNTATNWDADLLPSAAAGVTAGTEQFTVIDSQTTITTNNTSGNVLDSVTVSPGCKSTPEVR